MANPVTYNSGSNPTGALKSGTVSVSVAPYLNISLGGIRATGNSLDYIKGSISNLMVYNFELDLTQISNNFNAQKNRYGL
jgi:hypothetical protein